MTERDVRAEIREWLTEMAARWPDGMPMPTPVLAAHWPVREYGMRCDPPRGLGSPYERVSPLDVTFYAVLDDGTEEGSEITVPVARAALQVSR